MFESFSAGSGQAVTINCSNVTSQRSIIAIFSIWKKTALMIFEPFILFQLRRFDIYSSIIICPIFVINPLNHVH